MIDKPTTQPPWNEALWDFPELEPMSITESIEAQGFNDCTNGKPYSHPHTPGSGFAEAYRYGWNLADDGRDPK